MLWTTYSSLQASCWQRHACSWSSLQSSTPVHTVGALCWLCTTLPRACRCLKGLWASSKRSGEVLFGTLRYTLHLTSLRDLQVNQRLVSRAASDAQGAHAPEADTLLNPWPFGFQVSERTLVWSDHAQRRLLKIHAAKSLGKVSLSDSLSVDMALVERLQLH